MKKYYSLLSILVYIVLAACNNQANNIVIKGNIKNYEGKLLYAKQIDAISYHSNSLLDSAIVDENGAFEFELSQTTPMLLNLSKYNRQHPVHSVLQDDPETYYYGYCAMFYIPEPTLYLDEPARVELDWTVKNQLDSFSFQYTNVDAQKEFYQYYLKENLSEGLYEEGGNFKPMTIEKAWGIIEQVTNETLAKYKVQEQGKENSFQNYLHTEIKLGGINMLLNWLEHLHKDQLEEAFSSGVLPSLYTHAFELYTNGQWNSKSVEYYKMTERFLTFNLNKAYGKFEQYYPPNEEKLNMAKKVLSPLILDKYVANIKL